MTEAHPGGDRTGLSTARGTGGSELLTRILSAVVMAALSIGTAWVGGFVFDLFWFVAAVAVLWEWHGLVGTSRRGVAVAVGGVAVGIAAMLAAAGRPGPAVAALLLGSAVTPMARPASRAMASAGPLYAGALAVALPLLRASESYGFTAILWLFAVVWGTDTMAFFGGRAIGGPKLAPRLSPAKTWSGFAIGVVSGAVLGLLVAPRSGAPVVVVAAGLLGGALAQAGDLFESFLKRRFGVKDAGSLIPGHGGVMDRLDGFIAASIFAAAVGLWRFGPADAGAGLLKW